MSFGLTNMGATFQKVMEKAFKSMLERFVLIYMDDITIYSKCVADNLDHLKKVFIKSREYDVSLNPKKCVFATDQGKLLGHIV